MKLWAASAKSSRAETPGGNAGLSPKTKSREPLAEGAGAAGTARIKSSV